MPTLPHLLGCAAAALLFWTCIGLAVARRLVPERSLGLAMAPALGWAVFCAAAFPVLLLVGLTPVNVALLCAAVLLLALADLARRNVPVAERAAAVPYWAYVAALLLAIAPALALVPKMGGGAVTLAAPMYDHSKVAMIDEIARLGLPAENPFFSEAGVPPGLPYYYLWHFSAALFPLVLGVTGWEADIALTWFTAFAALALMMGLAVWISGRAVAALWVVLLSLAASSRPLLDVLLGRGITTMLLSSSQELQSWIVQTSWVPQHVAAASSVLIAVLLIARLANAGGWQRVLVLALVVAASFESSTWIGGVTFAAAALPLGLAALAAARPGQRWRFCVDAGLAALLALLLAAPFLHDEFVATAARGAGIPIAFRPFEVLGPAVPDSLRRVLDLPAYWLVLLVIDLPAIYLAGVLGLRTILAARDISPYCISAVLHLALLAASGLAVAWLFMSTIMNNDLGWRAMLPAVLVLTVLAAAGLSRWATLSAWPPMAAALLLFLAGLPAGAQFIAQNATGVPARSTVEFAASPALWQAVRRHTAPAERIANNPLFVADLVRWPINVGWALLADRRSCFASWDLVRPFVALPAARVDELNELFERVFAGRALPGDVQALAQRYDCRVAVVVPSDGAWRNDPFAESGYYRLAEENPGKWRIYRTVAGAR